MKKLYSNYIESFKGLSKEIWCISLVSLVNRAGTMVIPFLSLYLTKNLEFSKDDAGWILAFFGIGSVIGGWLGGKLTDLFGFYKVMIASLFLTGLCFIGLQYMSTFWGLCIGILITMSIADTFRPAIYVSIKAYTTEENQTRAIGLLRLAINIGMGIGPTLAGLIIVSKGYNILFWIDGITCILAILIFRYLVKEPKTQATKLESESENLTKQKNTVYKDITYWIFIAMFFFMGMTFFQLVVTMPLYYEGIFGLNEFQIGLFWMINIGLIIVLEMPFLNFLEKQSITVTKLILISCLLMSISFYILYQNFWLGILVISMSLITFGEMLGFPYTNRFALSRAKEGFEGSYMALYTMAFSLSHIFSSKIGLSIVERFGYQINWLVTGTYGLIAVILSYWLHNRVKNKLKMKKIVFPLLVLFALGCNNKVETTQLQVENTFIEKQFPKLEPNRYNVAFLIMDGTYNTELTAPYDIFQHTIFRENIKAMNVFTVANTDDPIITFEGMRILPDFNYVNDSLPKIDILVVPSAEHHLDTDLKDEAMLNFVKKVGKDAEFITSHCDGAFILAEAGLLKNKVSTTFPTDIDKMRERYPSLDIRKDVLFVHNGKYITSAGGAKSFEAALYLCEYLYGKEIAESLSAGLVIDWDLTNVPHLIIE